MSATRCEFKGWSQHFSLFAKLECFARSIRRGRFTPGRRFDRASSSIFPHLAQAGGIRPIERIRSYRTLSLADREEISRGLAAEQSLRSITRTLKRAPSTISREVGRNGGRKAYRAEQSDQRAWDCARRPKACKLSFNEPLCAFIARKLQLKWSPQQIAGWLKRRNPDEEQRRVSHALTGRALRSKVPRGERSIAAFTFKPVGS